MLRWLLILVVLLAGCSTTAAPPTPTSTPTDTPEVVEREVTTGTVNLSGLPVATEFTIESPDPSFEFPVTIKFKRPEMGNYTPVQVFRVSEGEPFEVELLPDMPYLIEVEDAEGDGCTVGFYRYVDDGHDPTIIINGGHVTAC